MAAAVVAVGSIMLAVTDQPPISTTAAPREPVAGALTVNGSGAPEAADRVAPAALPLRATALTIPALDLRTDLIDLGVEPDGTLQVPPAPDLAGWFSGGAAPGESGPAVIAGHVDSRSGPGIFYRLGDLVPGAEIEVGRSDGRVVRFRVVDVQVVPKDAFPTTRVYGPTPGPELRLITCGGEFDHDARRYLRNVVVSAVMIDLA